MQYDDKQHLEKLPLGDHEAYKSLFMKYFPKVKYFIAHLIKSEAVAEELAQDIFMKIWENRDSLASVQSFNSYVYRMAKNIALNYLEHRYVEQSYMDNYQGETAISIEEDFYARELELLERLTVNNMPHQRKTIYEMSRKKGFSNNEIAQELGISKKTVENHLNLALKEIRKSLSLLFLFFI